MIICEKDRYEGNTENDNRILKLKFKIRKSYSIEIVLIEEYLLYDISIQNQETTIYNFAN